MKLEPCQERHKFRWIETIRRKKAAENGFIEYILTDRFYCTHCLHIQERRQVAIKAEDSKDLPGWF